MNKLIYIIILFSSCIQENISDDNSLFAIKRSDNTFVSFKDTVSEKAIVPKIVEHKIRNELSKDKTGKLDNVFIITYSEKIHLYVCKIKYIYAIEYIVILHNNVLNKVSDKVIDINGTFSDNNENGFVVKLINKPLLEIVDIDGDGNKEVLIRERKHNGTSYNAVVAKYYKIINELEFKKMILIEERNKNPMNNCIIERRLTSDFSINSFLNCKDSVLSKIGFYKIDLKTGLLYDKYIYNDEFENQLITGSGENELKFTLDFR